MVARQFPNGFAMTIAATPRKRDKLAAQLTWLANRQVLGLPEDRRHGRMTPRNPSARLILPNGVNIAVRVVDISQSGAAIATDQRPDDRRPRHHRQDRRRASCAISKMALRSSSCACSIQTSSKTTSPAGKRRDGAVALCRRFWRADLSHSDVLPSPAAPAGAGG